MDKMRVTPRSDLYKVPILNQFYTLKCKYLKRIRNKTCLLKRNTWERKMEWRLLLPSGVAWGRGRFSTIASSPGIGQPDSKILLLWYQSFSVVGHCDFLWYCRMGKRNKWSKRHENLHDWGQLESEHVDDHISYFFKGPGWHSVFNKLVRGHCWI